ncbi:MAG TPA: hypothetical protein PLN19_02135 [Methanothrix sp.]|nr:hypothetical protein [Methanothrix sp.]HPC88809.1 hypothetical protein [Methanothrix sp.]HQE87051.1 hypothetical protein [Methanothrix sp.]HQI67435.1 hypothetical protein [Methanothrix sp.]HRS84785.1 hypothetical protein [Methanothrix sp.]
MKPLSGWEGPAVLREGVLRYSKYVSWARLYIDLAGGELCGGACGCSRNFEVAKEDGSWMLYETDIAKTPAGEPVMRLYAFTTWDVVYERISEGRPVEDGIEGIEDLAGLLERVYSARADQENAAAEMEGLSQD